jgi:hypothetical protein
MHASNPDMMGTYMPLGSSMLEFHQVGIWELAGLNPKVGWHASQ